MILVQMLLGAERIYVVPSNVIALTVLWAHAVPAKKMEKPNDFMIAMLWARNL
jgi:hypothetical protein